MTRGQYDVVYGDIDGCTDQAWLECADVLCAGDPRPEPEAARLAARTLRRYPGCLLAVVRSADGGCAAATGAGLRVVVTPSPGGGGLLAGNDFQRFAELLYEWVTAVMNPTTGRAPLTAPQCGARPPH